MQINRIEIGIISIDLLNNPIIMYYPYLRAKQFELYALEEVNVKIYKNTLPIVEPVTSATNKVANGIYRRLAVLNRAMILIINPQHGKLNVGEVETHLVNGLLTHHSALTLGYIITNITSASEIKTFLSSHSGRQKALIFRGNLVPKQLAAVDTIVKSTPPAHLIFDSSKTGRTTQNAFSWHSQRVLITDGFDRQDRNLDYPVTSGFNSDYATYRADGWQGIGDFLTIGDSFKEGGGQPYVVTLHITRNTTSGLIAHHFSSSTLATIPGDAPLKFIEACKDLVTSRHTTGLLSSGMTEFRNWHSTSFFPGLGAPKQASMQHHIELLSSLV